MKYFYVYILKCNDDSYYVGQTDDLEKRVADHQDKIVSGYTSTRLPVTLVFHIALEERSEAFKLEQKLKGWTRKKKEALITGDFKLLTEYAKKKFCDPVHPECSTKL